MPDPVSTPDRHPLTPVDNGQGGARPGIGSWQGKLLKWVFIFFLTNGLMLGAEPQYSEYEVKGAFLAKFAVFVEWPEKAFADKQAPIVIGIIGEDPFGPGYEAALSKEVANGRKFVLRRLKTAREVTECHILFVSASESDRLLEILETTRGKAVLTVGDQERFAHRGGMLNFVKEDGKLRFEVNPAAVETSGLKMSAKLLQVAKPVVKDAAKGGK